jgi:hypothetical protein
MHQASEEVTGFNANITLIGPEPLLKTVVSKRRPPPAWLPRHGSTRKGSNARVPEPRADSTVPLTVRLSHSKFQHGCRGTRGQVWLQRSGYGCSGEAFDQIWDLVRTIKAYQLAHIILL